MTAKRNLQSLETLNSKEKVPTRLFLINQKCHLMNMDFLPPDNPRNFIKLRIPLKSNQPMHGDTSNRT